MSFPENVGDRGQRYEVSCINGNGERFVVGWTKHADGGALVAMVRKHPMWHSPEVVDRRPEGGGA